MFQIVNYDYLNLFKGNAEYLEKKLNPETGQYETILVAEPGPYDFASVHFTPNIDTPEELEVHMKESK